MKHGAQNVALSQNGVEQDGCQHSAHIKAFTGKGTNQRLVRQAQLDVEKVHSQLRELSKITRSVPARLFYLALHTRATTEQLSLRWRKAGCSRNTHLSWSEMPNLFTTLAPVLAEWYRKVDKRARILNREEQLARAMLRQAQALLTEEEQIS